VGFGFSHHNCLGATQARQILKTLITVISEKVSAMEVVSFEENIEDFGEHKRKVGFHKLVLNFK
jgi:cytochrome P450